MFKLQEDATSTHKTSLTLVCLTQPFYNCMELLDTDMWFLFSCLRILLTAVFHSICCVHFLDIQSTELTCTSNFPASDFSPAYHAQSLICCLLCVYCWLFPRQINVCDNLEEKHHPRTKHKNLDEFWSCCITCSHKLPLQHHLFLSAPSYLQWLECYLKDHSKHTLRACAFWCLDPWQVNSWFSFLYTLFLFFPSML